VVLYRLCKELGSLEELSLFEDPQLVETYQALLDHEVLVSSEALAVNDCVFEITLDCIKQLVKSAAADHKIEEALLLLYLGMLAADREIVLPFQEGGSQLAYELSLQVEG